MKNRINKHKQMYIRTMYYWTNLYERRRIKYILHRSESNNNRFWMIE